MALRALRRAPLAPSSWGRMARARHAIRSRIWDFVIDTQGLVKSAMVARFARAPAFGLDAKSARERLAARFYDVKVRVPRDLHAVERNRRLVAEVFGYTPRGVARYGLLRPDAAPEWAPSARYVVMLHAASRAAKRWPDERWIALGKLLASQGYVAVFPGGTTAERASAARLASAIPGAVAAPPVSLVEAAALLAHAAGVVGVDTGLTHLAGRARRADRRHLLRDRSRPHRPARRRPCGEHSEDADKRPPSRRSPPRSGSAPAPNDSPMMRVVYALAWVVATPFVLARLAWRARRQRGYLDRLGERFGRYAAVPPGPRIWIHAVSVGETRAAVPLVDALKARHPRHRILVTHMTPTGPRDGREELFGDRVERAWLPYDLGFAVRRFLEHFRPEFGIILETEIWPRLLEEARAAHPGGARQRAALRALRAALCEVPALTRWAFANLTGVAAQTESDARRFASIGARIAVLGNVKFDLDGARRRWSSAGASFARASARRAGLGRGQHARGRGSAPHRCAGRLRRPRRSAPRDRAAPSAALRRCRALWPKAAASRSRGAAPTCPFPRRPAW